MIDSTAMQKLVQASLGTFGILLATTLLSGVITLNTAVHADTTKIDTLNIDILAACTMTRTDSTGGNYSASLIPGQSVELGPTSVKTICNDNNGYAIYAIGYSGNTYTGATHTDLISATNSSYNIHTNTPSSAGSSSYWSMKLASVSSGDYTPTIENSYSSYNVIPNTYTKVVSLNKATDAGTGATGSNFNATYEIKAASDQVADAYSGKIKYTLVHPNNAAAPTVPPDMQNFTLAQCQTNATDHDYVVRDRRDGSEYTVRYINGNCWMTQNLRITHSMGQPEGTILGTDSNFSATSFTFDGDLTLGDDYTQAYYHTPTAEDIAASGNQYTAEQLGAWYNFCAASAGEVCQSDTAQDSTQDICPAGWRLPTGGTTSGEMYDLGVFLESDPSSFSPIKGGRYVAGELDEATDYGYWFTSTGANSTGQRISRYAGNYFAGNYNQKFTKRRGIYIRCIRST